VFHRVQSDLSGCGTHCPDSMWNGHTPSVHSNWYCRRGILLFYLMLDYSRLCCYLHQLQRKGDYNKGTGQKFDAIRPSQHGCFRSVNGSQPLLQETFDTIFFTKVRGTCRKHSAYCWLPRAVEGILRTDTPPCLRRDSNPRRPSGWESDVLTIRPRRSTLLTWSDDMTFFSYPVSIRPWKVPNLCENLQLYEPESCIFEISIVPKLPKKH
jgi:hypothetical protein